MEEKEEAEEDETEGKKGGKDEEGRGICWESPHIVDARGWKVYNHCLLESHRQMSAASKADLVSQPFSSNFIYLPITSCAKNMLFLPAFIGFDEKGNSTKIDFKGEYFWKGCICKMLTNKQRIPSNLSPLKVKVQCWLLGDLLHAGYPNPKKNYRILGQTEL